MRQRISAVCASLVPAIWLLAGGAQAESCPLPNQSSMLVVKLYFGEATRHGNVSTSAWSRFLRDAVTARFPDGFTVYDGYGQWMDTRSHAVVRERSKIVEIAAPDTPETRNKIEGLAETYKRRFHQQSVGIVTVPGCGAF